MTNQQQPDKFFREKLENFQRPAPAAAWDRIESNLKKNNTKGAGWWWKVAASFLLLTTAAYLLWPSEIADRPLSTIKKQEVSIPESKSNIDKKDSTPTIQKSPRPAAGHAKKVVVSEKKNTNKSNSIKTRPLTESTSAQTLASSTDQNSSVQPIAELSETIVAVAKKTESVPAKKIKLQFSAEETNKYLDQNAVAQATSEEKKSSTWKRLLKKAGDLKTNQDPFGDLREKKNEILALNFKNEKRGQNK